MFAKLWNSYLSAGATYEGATLCVGHYPEAYAPVTVAREALAQALEQAPWGAQGNSFIQEHRLWICGPVRKVLSINREPVATLSADGFLTVRGDSGWYMPSKGDTRAANRAAAKDYTQRMDKAVEAVLRGEVLPYCPGQKGGTLGGVSARGLAKRLGVTPPADVEWGDPEGRRQSTLLTLRACALAQGSWAPKDCRARATERAKRNAPATLPRVDRKRFKESRHLPTWRWLVTAA